MIDDKLRLSVSGGQPVRSKYLYVLYIDGEFHDTTLKSQPLVTFTRDKAGEMWAVPGDYGMLERNRVGRMNVAAAKRSKAHASTIVGVFDTTDQNYLQDFARGLVYLTRALSGEKVEVAESALAEV